MKGIRLIALFGLLGFFSGAFAAESKKAKSADGTQINYTTSGKGETALVFVHGWIGNLHWWDDQKVHFSKRYQVVQMDLAGHGESGKGRKEWTPKAYGEDIRAVVDALGLKRVVLIGHSMSGVSIVEAFHLLPGKVIALVTVDTLLDVSKPLEKKQSDEFFGGLRKDYKGYIQTNFQQFLFTKKTPPEIVKRITEEALASSPEIAIPALETIYSADVRPQIGKIFVPVRQINSDKYPTNSRANRQYIRDYNYQIVSGYGHYPMLEAPAQFNAALDIILGAL